MYSVFSFLLSNSHERITLIFILVMIIINKLIRTNYLNFIFIFLFLTIVTGCLGTVFNFPEEASDNQVVNELKQYPLIIYFLITVIFVPFFETIIFQGVIIEVIRLKVKKKLRFCLSIIISSLCFGLSHPYSVYYVLITTLIGLLFALSYNLCIYRKQSSIFTVFILHGILNLTAFIEVVYF